jgi:hypothetical protein
VRQFLSPIGKHAISRRDQYGDPEDYQDPPAWVREPSPVVVVVLILVGAGMLGLAACAIVYFLARVQG